jgi:hypothetical protein
LHFLLFAWSPRASQLHHLRLPTAVIMVVVIMVSTIMAAVTDAGPIITIVVTADDSHLAAGAQGASCVVAAPGHRSRRPIPTSEVRFGSKADIAERN